MLQCASEPRVHKQPPEVRLMVKNPLGSPGHSPRPRQLLVSINRLPDINILSGDQACSNQPFTLSPPFLSHLSVSAMMTQWKKTAGRKNMRLIYLLQVLSLSYFPVFSLFFSANWNQLASRALVARNVGQARSNKKVLTFLWLYVAWKGCRGLVRHERSSINFTYFTQAPVRRL